MAVFVMADREGRGGGDNYVPIVAGVVIGAGLLAVGLLWYFSGSGGCKTRSGTPETNKQKGAPHFCTCQIGGKDAVRAHTYSNIFYMLCNLNTRTF